jgi:DNA-binding NtrC family response regulator
MLNWRAEIGMNQTTNSKAGYTAILVCEQPDKMAEVTEALDQNQVKYETVRDVAAALRNIRKNLPDFAFVHRDLAGGTGIRAVQRLKKRHPLLSAALVGPQVSAEARRSFIADGADDYIEVFSDRTMVDASIHSLIARKQSGILGRNDKILQIINIIEEIAPTKVTVLVTGESGTGKELIARAIHRRSDRADGPFVAVNCGALPQGVLESELFGHEKGSFTGATSQRAGRFEIADKGTLLLDEVGEMPLGTQVKLLRVLEEEKFMRVGGSKNVKVDVRVIAATNRDLKDLVDQGAFRRDLYYRLNVVPIHVPPLRERREDIRTILFGLAEGAAIANKIEFGGITEEALYALETYDWPGNVRELKNLVENLIVLSRGRRAGMGDLPEHIREADEDRRDLPIRVGRPREEIERDLLFGRLALIEKQIGALTEIVLNMKDGGAGASGFPEEASAVPGEATWAEVVEEPGEEPGNVTVKPGTRLRDVERSMIEQTLKQVGGNRKKAARLLGIGERTLYRRMKEYGLR